MLKTSSGNEVIDHIRENDFNKFIQDLTEQMNEFELFISGKRIVYDSKGKPSIEMNSSAKPLINEVGKNDVMARLRMLLNPNLYMSKISDEDTRRMYRTITASFRRMFIQNHVLYDLTLSNAYTISDHMEDIVFFALRKAESDKPSIYGSMDSKNESVNSPIVPYLGNIGSVGQDQGFFKR